jgi:hypothetical protein
VGRQCAHVMTAAGWQTSGRSCGTTVGQLWEQAPVVSACLSSMTVAECIFDIGHPYQGSSQLSFRRRHINAALGSIRVIMSSLTLAGSGSNSGSLSDSLGLALRIPLDVVEPVLDELADEDLKACSLVHRTWTFPAQARLFSTVSYIEPNAAHVRAHPNSLNRMRDFWPRLVALLATSPHIRPHI